MGLLAHQAPQVRAEAADALGHIGDREAVSFLVDALIREKQDEQVAVALAEIGDSTALPQLLAAFAQADRFSRPNIALALAAFPSPKVFEVLISNLADPDPNVRFNCVTALSRLRDPAAVSPLLACLGEANEWIFLNVVNGLARLGDQRAANPMIAFFLKEPNERKRAAIISALGRIRDLTSLPTLTKALRDPDDRVKSNAIEAIKLLGLPSDKVLNLLHPFLKHPHHRVRGNAVTAIADLDADAAGASLEAMAEDPNKWMRATLGFILSGIPYQRAVHLILRLLKDGDADVRKNGARALAKQAKDKETEILIRLLNDQTPFLRLQAAVTLGRLRSVPAISSLMKLFSHERNFKIRSAIISALGCIGDKSALKTVTQAIADLDSRVRANAVESLEKILGAESAPLIYPLLKDTDNRTRANAAKALFSNGDTSVLPTLETMLQEAEISTKISAAYALGQIGLSLRELARSPLSTPLKSSLDTVVVPGTRTDPSRETDRPSEPTTGSTAVLAKGKTTSAPGEGEDSGRESLRRKYLDHHGQGHYKESLEAVEAFLSRFPGDLAGNLFAASANFQLSRFDEAIGHYKKCIELDPFHLQAYSSLAMACYKGGRIQEAIHYFKQALKIKPDMAGLRFNLANLLLRENSFEEAILQYEEGLRYQAAGARILANLAFACQKTGLYEKAVTYYGQANLEDPREAGIYYNWALILARQGKRLEALEVLEKALKSVPIGSTGLKNIRDLQDRLKSAGS
jgi:HEAT repeat protein/Flp pilus assembly protein TadD